MKVLDSYDYDQMYPIYGFGGRILTSPHGNASHCFALNGNIFKPEVKGINGIMDAYYNSLSKTSLHGPTYLAKILDYVNGYVRFYSQEVS